MPRLRRSGAGEALLAQRARPTVVFHLVSVHGPALAALTGVPALVAAVEGQLALTAALALASLVPLAAYALQRRSGPPPRPRRVEALVAVAASFLIGAALAVPGFLVLGLAPVDALFEAMSAITTTGLSVASGAEAWPLSAHFLRAWLQWAGGFAFAALALALLPGPGVLARRLGMVEKPGWDLLGSTAARARLVLGVYLVLSALAVAASALAAERPLEGVLVALAAVSTGGFAPAADSLAGSGLPLQIVTAAAVMAGAVSITLYAQAWRQGPGLLWRDRELRVLLGLALAGALAMIAVEAARPEGAGPWDAAFLAFSAQSTAGFSTVPVGGLAPASLILLIGLMGVGGSLGATAGGIKVSRAVLAVLIARAALLRTQLSPKALFHVRLFGRKPEPDEETSAFALIVLYTTSVGLLWLALVTFGHAPLPALFDTVSAFSTVGLSAGVAGPELSGPLKLGFVVAMLLGRLEFLAAILLFRPATWFR